MKNVKSNKSQLLMSGSLFLALVSFSTSQAATDGAFQAGSSTGTAEITATVQSSPAEANIRISGLSDLDLGTIYERDLGDFPNHGSIDGICVFSDTLDNYRVIIHSLNGEGGRFGSGKGLLIKNEGGTGTGLEYDYSFIAPVYSDSGHGDVVNSGAASWQDDSCGGAGTASLSVSNLILNGVGDGFNWGDTLSDTLTLTVTPL